MCKVCELKSCQEDQISPRNTENRTRTQLELYYISGLPATQNEPSILTSDCCWPDVLACVRRGGASRVVVVWDKHLMKS